MQNYFPRQTIDWRLEEPAAFRRFSISLLEMGMVTGVLLRVLRALTFTLGRASWLYYGGALLVGAILLVGMATAHLANFPVRRWYWRAPAFALVESAAEMATSLFLIAIHREPEGAARAGFHDWPSMAIRTLLQSELTICLWVLVLAGAIVLARRSGMAAGVDSDPLDPALPPPPPRTTR